MTDQPEEMASINDLQFRILKNECSAEKPLAEDLQKAHNFIIEDSTAQKGQRLLKMQKM